MGNESNGTTQRTIEKTLDKEKNQQFDKWMVQFGMREIWYCMLLYPQYYDLNIYYMFSNRNNIIFGILSHLNTNKTYWDVCNCQQFSFKYFQCKKFNNFFLNKSAGLIAQF